MSETVSPAHEWHLVKTKREYLSHLESVADLFQIVFRRDFPWPQWNQYYLENPFGDPIVGLTYLGSTLVGHQALIPGIASDGKIKVPYHLSMSTMIHPDHRGLPTLIRLFESTQNCARELGSAFVVGFPNRNLYMTLRRCLGYKSILESRLYNWIPPMGEPCTITPDLPELGFHSGCFAPLLTGKYWPWRSGLNGARIATVNKRVRFTYKTIGNQTLNILNIELLEKTPVKTDLAALASIESCKKIRITDYHANLLGIPLSELFSHEDYCVRMHVLPLSQSVPDLQFNLLFCDVF